MTDLRVAASTFPFLYSHSGLDAALHLADLGYREQEMMIFPPHCWPAELSPDKRKQWKAAFDDRGISFTSFCYPALDNNPNSVDRLMRQYTLDRYLEAIDLAAEWDCPYVVMIPGPVNSLIDPPYQWMYDWFVEAAKKVVAHAKPAGVEILLENVPFTFLPTIDDMLGVAGDIGGVAMNYDVCNAAYIDEDLGAAIRKMGPLCKNVHISDSPKDVFLHARLGTGVVDPAPVGAALAEIGYTGATVLEIIADATKPENDPDGDIKASHAIIAKHGWASPAA